MKIAAFIRGYNNLLQAANQGVGLAESSDVLAPVLDVRTMLEGNNRKYAIANGNAGTAAVQLFGPPIGEIWRIKAFGVRFTAGAGAALGDSYLFMNFPGAGLLPLCNVQSLVASREIVQYADLMVDQLLYPGEGLGIDAAAVTLTPTYVAYLVYDRVASASA